MSMNEFYTRDNANEGIEIPLFKPGSSTPSEHSLRIRGVDSDEFRHAEIETKRSMRELVEGKKTVEEKDVIHNQHLTKLIASLVISWTFPEECTRENVIKFLTNAPQIADQINQLASRRALFFKNGSTNSVNTSEPISN